MITVSLFEATDRQKSIIVIKTQRS